MQAENSGVMLKYATALLAATLPTMAELATPDQNTDALPTPVAQTAAEEGAQTEEPQEKIAPAEEVAETQPADTSAQPSEAEHKETPSPATNTLADAYRGIVKIEVANRIPDYAVPWQAGHFGRGNGTGFMVGPGLFMTNAHVVANAERIYVSPYADAHKIRAKVKYVAHDADLALVEVEDAAAFKGVPFLEFSDKMPHLEDEVRAIGYPIGGNRLSVTRGIVSRIDTIPYAHPLSVSHLTVQVDAAINPGNSGGPVLMGDKVVGVAFQGLQQANSTGYMIPLPVIQRFLQDVSDGHYDHYVDLGVEFFSMENPAMRRHYGLPDDAQGALVGDVVKGGCSDGQLEPGDVVLSVNGLPVDSSAMIELEGERVKLEELAERAFMGDVLTFGILRKGECLEKQVKLAPLPGSSITGNVYDELPRYVQFAGLVFQPLQRNVVVAHRLEPMSFIVEMDDFLHQGGATKKQDIVLMTKVLRDEVNARFTDYGSRIVTKVNGVEVKGLEHLYTLLYPAEGQERPPFMVIEFKDASRPFVVDSSALPAAGERISTSYNIPESARLK